MRKLLFFSGITFAVTLGVVIGFRISADAMAVIIGIICGVLASIPTTVILLWVLRQRDRQLEVQGQQGQYGGYPPVVVVNGQGTNGYGSGTPPPLIGSASSSSLGSRDFKVVGQENTESAGDLLPSFWE